MSAKRPQFPIPKTLANGRYSLRRPLGVGGMAAVYLAVDHWSGDECAIKVLLPSAAKSDKTVTRFLTEARTMKHLDHPNIIRILDVGQEEDHYYFAMEIAELGNLIALLRREGTQKPTRALQLMFQALRGLGHAHAAGVVHRDVKPHNMLLDKRGVLKLTDFGIARVVDLKSGDARITSTGDTLGTLAYMAPEQRTDPRNVTVAADIYGIGATLYLLITGRRPMELSIARLDDRVMSRVPEALRPIIRTATAQRPRDRYQTTRDMAQAIAEALENVDDHYSGRVGPMMLSFDELEEDTILRVSGEGD